MQIFHSDHFVLPLPAGHSFPMPKYRLLREAAERDLPGVRVQEAPAASDGELALAHTPTYIAAVAEGTAERGAAARDRLPVVAAHGRARPALGGCHDRRRACRAGRGRGRQLRRRHAPCVRRPRLGLLRLQRRRGGGAADAGRVAPPAAPAAARAHRRPRRAPGQRHGGAVPGRPDRVHAVAARREELPGAQGGERPRCRAARRLHRRALPAGAGRRAGRGLAPPRRRAAGPGLLPRRRRPARGRPPGPAEDQRRGLAERDRRVFAALRARGIPVAVAMAGGYGRDIATTVGLQLRTLELALHSWQAWSARLPMLATSAP
jgi:hypothetical protein